MFRTKNTPPPYKATNTVPANGSSSQNADQKPSGFLQNQGLLTSYVYLLAILSVFALVSIAFYLLLYSQNPTLWQIRIAVSFIALGLIFSPVVYFMARGGRLWLSGILLLIGGTLAYGGNEISWSGLTWYHLVGGSLLIILVGATVMTRRWPIWTGWLAVYWIYILIVNQFPPIFRYDASQSVALLAYALISNMLLASALLLVFFQVLQQRSIRLRLLTVIIMLVLLPLGVTTIITVVVGNQNAQRQVANQLETVASFRSNEVANWKSQLITTLQGALPPPDSMWVVRTTLTSKTNDMIFQTAYSQVQGFFGRYLQQNNMLAELFLVDMDGKVVFSSDLSKEGAIYQQRSFFTNGLKNTYVSPVEEIPGEAQPSIIVAMPMEDASHTILGVLAGRVNLDQLNGLFVERSGLGQTGETYLVTPSYKLLTASRFQGYDIHKSVSGTNGLKAALENHANGNAVYRSYHGDLVIGVYRWLPDFRVALLAEQGQAEATSGMIPGLLVSAGVALGALILSIVAALIATQRIVRPLGKLATSAEQIAAGDLQLTVAIEQEDEIGTLAKAFNSMTAQLRGLIANLEQRVTARTKELERRSLQLQVAAEVARDTASLHEMKILLERAVNLIHDRFGFYYTGLFLEDERNEFAVLRAATGDAGRQMIADELKLKIGGQGIVGHVSSVGEPRVVKDVSNDPYYIRHPLLPNTKSELALPLMAGTRIIGVLDVQRDTLDAFEADEISVLQTLSDQLAVAIESARLIQNMQQTLSQLETVQGDYTRQSWKGFARRPGRRLGYRYRGFGLEPTTKENPEAVQAFLEGKPVISKLSESALDQGMAYAEQSKSAMAVPVKIRDQVIGVINVRFGNSAISSDVVNTFEEIASRLSLALEGARLLEETQLRTEQLNLLQEITSTAVSHVRIKELLFEVANKLCKDLDLMHCGVTLYDANRHTGTLLADIYSKEPPLEEMTGQSVDLSQDQPALQIQQSHKAMVFYNDQDIPDLQTLYTKMNKLGTYSMVVAPLLSRGEIMGYISMDVIDPQRRFAEDDLRLIDQIALQIATAIEVARFFEQTEQRAERERMISEITSKVRASTSLDTILQTAVQELAEALHIPHGQIQLRGVGGLMADDYQMVESVGSSDGGRDNE